MIQSNGNANQDSNQKMQNNSSFGKNKFIDGSESQR
jgi:hypothetical protein